MKPTGLSPPLLFLNLFSFPHRFPRGYPRRNAGADHERCWPPVISCHSFGSLSQPRQRERQREYSQSHVSTSSPSSRAMAARMLLSKILTARGRFALRSRIRSIWAVKTMTQRVSVTPRSIHDWAVASSSRNGAWRLPAVPHMASMHSSNAAMIWVGSRSDTEYRSKRLCKRAATCYG